MINAVNKALETYTDPRIWQILGFGFVSGLPLAVGRFTNWRARLVRYMARIVSRRVPASPFPTRF